MELAIETSGLSKSFPGVQALSGVNLRVRKGSCHALVGENGAGKSTLGKVIAGVHPADAGQVRMFGEEVRFASPQQAIRRGVFLVHQELLFCENLSVAENLCLDSPPTRWGLVDYRVMRDRAKHWLEAVESTINPEARLGSLPVGKQQLVQIAGAVGRDARVLVFDEPTSSLSAREAGVLFSQIRKLVADGITCIYVSHRMEEVFELCDELTVLRDGKHVSTKPIDELSRADVVRMMVGRDVSLERQEVGCEPGDVLLEARGLSSPAGFEGVSFSARAGEIVGMCGLVGSGRTEIAQALFGLDPRARGKVLIRGKEVVLRSPAQAMAHGLGLVPEDRKRHGLVLGMTARENITLPTLGSMARCGFVQPKVERSVAGEAIHSMRVRTPSMEVPTAGLSGGNQQKLVIAKWLAAQCDVLLLDEPTRGVDVGAKADIYSLIRGLAREGKAILVISSELPELLVLATRILAVRNGRIVRELHGSEATEEVLMRWMTGVAAPEESSP